MPNFSNAIALSMPSVPGFSVTRVPHGCYVSRLVAVISFTLFSEELSMGDMKDKIKDGIDKAADKTKDMAGKAVDKSKDAAKAAGDSMKRGGDKMKDAGK